MSITPRTETFAALREHEERLKEPFPDPYGQDHWKYERAKQSDPEWQRLYAAFLAARQASS